MCVFMKKKIVIKKQPCGCLCFGAEGGLAVGGNRLHRRVSEDGCQPHAHGGLQVELACIKQRAPQR